jgi:hypothetical protein
MAEQSFGLSGQRILSSLWNVYMGRDSLLLCFILFHSHFHCYQYLFLAILEHKLTDIVYSTGCGMRFVDLVEGYEIMAGYDNLMFGMGVPGWGTDGILEADERLKMNKRSEQMESDK